MLQSRLAVDIAHPLAEEQEVTHVSQCNDVGKLTTHEWFVPQATGQ